MIKTINDFKYFYRFVDETQVAAISDIAAIEPDENVSDGEDSEAEDDLVQFFNSVK